ncbi:MAG TPA: hypothetical protein VF951_08840, partial [Streptosporangiaceae bacterium]
MAVAIAVNQLTIAAAAAAPASTPAIGRSSIAASGPCTVDTPAQAARSQCPRPATATDVARVTLPAGAAQCLHSGPGAACSGSGAAQATPGISSVPNGLSACPVTAGKPGPSTPAACDGTLLPAAEPNVPVGSFAPPLVTPSVPIASLEVEAQHLKLTADAS